MNASPFALSLLAQVNTSLAAQETSVPGGTLLLLAYLGLWALILGFLVVILRNQRAVERDLDDLERRLDALAESRNADKD